MADDAYVFARSLPGEEVVCCFNNSDEEVTVTIPLGETLIPNGSELERLDAEGALRAVDGHLDVTLPAKGYAFYRRQ